jgi:hypothetical protein
MRRTPGLVGVALVIGILAAAFPAQGALAAVPPVTALPAGVGVDVSWPQCNRDHTFVPYPSGLPFAVVGVNGGNASNLNDCFAGQYTAALLMATAPQTEQPRAAAYLNTGNPALAGAWWPSSDYTEYQNTLVPTGSLGDCKGLADKACAYVYGYSKAEDDVNQVRSDLSQLPSTWWLDVETSNTWQTDVKANEASLDGMVDYLKGQGITAIGVYSTGYQWNKIVGVTAATSPLAGLQSWLAGSSPTGAAAACEGSPLTPGGRVSMVQYIAGGFDDDLSCHVFPSAVTISAAASQLVGATLSASTGWPAGGSYAFQWRRNGIAISQATAGTYKTTGADVGKSITYTVTGKKLGYSTATATSSAVTVRALPAKRPTPPRRPAHVS